MLRLVLVLVLAFVLVSFTFELISSCDADGVVESDGAGLAAVACVDGLWIVGVVETEGAGLAAAGGLWIVAVVGWLSGVGEAETNSPISPASFTISS